VKIELRLKSLLKEHGLDRRGVVKELTAVTGVNRQTIQGLLHGRVNKPSLATLGKVCDWLRENGVASDVLPQALFGIGDADLWEACTRPGVVTLAIGENRSQSPEPKRPLWISKRDTALAFQLVRLLSDPARTGRPGTEIRTVYSPYHLIDNPRRRMDDEQLQRDIREASALFGRLDGHNTSTVLIGSVKSNYLVELFVAGLFGYVPFRDIGAAKAGSRPPIYMQYRATDRRPPSCMAGDGPPTGARTSEGPGMYYVKEKGAWTKASSIDTGVVITAHDPIQQKFQLAAFGFRGRTTEALGSQLRDRSTELWPTDEDDMGKGRPRIRIVLFSFHLPTDRYNLEDGAREPTSIVRVPADVVRARIASRGYRRSVRPG
jgi:transcriptional regulator with XRE-family HTH domain